MTVTENLLVGRHLLMHTGVFCGAFYFGRARREEMEERKAVEHIIDFFELYRYRDVPAGDLPYGVQKMVGVARALALDPELLLLDSPDRPDARGKGEFCPILAADSPRIAPHCAVGGA